MKPRYVKSLTHTTHDGKHTMRIPFIGTFEVSDASLRTQGGWGNLTCKILGKSHTKESILDIIGNDPEPEGLEYAIGVMGRALANIAEVAGQQVAQTKNADTNFIAQTAATALREASKAIAKTRVALSTPTKA